MTRNPSAMVKLRIGQWVKSRVWERKNETDERQTGGNHSNQRLHGQKPRRVVWRGDHDTSIASLSFYADDKRRESRMNGIRHEGVQANGVRLHVDRMGLELRTLSRCMAADNRLWGQRKIQALEAWVQSFQREEG